MRDNHRSQQVRIVLAAVVVFVFSLSACGHAEGSTDQAYESPNVSAVAVSELPADGTASVTGLVVKNYDKGTLPLDPYRQNNRRLQGYASDIYIALCMGKSNYKYPVVVYDWNDPSNEDSSGYSRIRNVEEARKYGYRLSPTDGDSDAAEQGEYIEAQSEAYKTALTSCYDDLADDSFFSGLIADDTPFTDGAEENPAVKAAMKEWRSCMAPLGISDLPEDHPGIAPSVAEKIGLNQATDGAAITDLTAITPYEIEVAETDAQCNASSGYDRLKYDLTWYGQDQLLQKYPAEYEARRELIETQTQELIDYIVANRDKVQ